MGREGGGGGMQRVRAASLLEGVCFFRDTGFGQQLTMCPRQVGSPFGSLLPHLGPVSLIFTLTAGLRESRVRRILLCQVETVVHTERVAWWEAESQCYLVLSRIFHPGEPLSISKVSSEPLSTEGKEGPLTAMGWEVTGTI